MDAILTSLFPEASNLKSLGNDVLVAGLVGEIAILFLPRDKITLEKILAGVFTLVIIVGVWMERVADARLTTPLSLSSDAQARIAKAVCSFGPQPLNELIVSADDTVFVGQVEHVWRTCQWKPAGLSNRDAVLAHVAKAEGIKFLYQADQPRMRDAATAFANALRMEVDINAVTEEMPSSIKPNAPVIIIVYGHR